MKRKKKRERRKKKKKRVKKIQKNRRDLVDVMDVSIVRKLEGNCLFGISSVFDCDAIMMNVNIKLIRKQKIDLV
jgi:polyferredoxin